MSFTPLHGNQCNSQFAWLKIIWYVNAKWCSFSKNCSVFCGHRYIILGCKQVFAHLCRSSGRNNFVLLHLSLLLRNVSNQIYLLFRCQTTLAHTSGKELEFECYQLAQPILYMIYGKENINQQHPSPGDLAGHCLFVEVMSTSDSIWVGYL